MTRAIQQSVKFRATPRQLFELYMDSKKHAAATGAPAQISRKTGARFWAHGGLVRGRNLMIIPNRLVVQAWRGPWRKSDPDSILVIEFRKAPGGARVDLVHAGVPAYDHEGVRKGWPKYYWKRWRAHLAGEKR